MMLRVMAKKSKRVKIGGMPIDKEKICFLLQRFKKKKLALYSHLRNAEQLFTAWGFTKKTQESHLVS